MWDSAAVMIRPATAVDARSRSTTRYPDCDGGQTPASTPARAWHGHSRKDTTPRGPLSFLPASGDRAARRPAPRAVSCRCFPCR